MRSTKTSMNVIIVSQSPGEDLIRKNTLRLVEVWLDDYKKYFYIVTGHDKLDFGDISDRVELRQKMNCKNFRWYVENVYPEISIPGKQKVLIDCTHFKTLSNVTDR